MTSHPIPGPVFLAGGTGKSGRRVAARLSAAGVPVRIGSRRGAIPFDWAQPRDWPAALAGASAAFVSYAPDLAAPGADKHLDAFARCAAAAGVGHLVLLSGRGEDEAVAAEQAVLERGVDVTILRASWFDQNFSEGYLLDPLLAGELALPADGVGEPFLDLDDLADAVVAVLAEPAHRGRVYELTGPRALSFAEATAEIAAAAGRPIRYTAVDRDTFAAGLTAAAVPTDVIELLCYLFATVLDGRNSRTTDGVSELLGRPARDFTHFTRSAAQNGAWK